jgi:hypothetical protein
MKGPTETYAESTPEVRQIQDSSQPPTGSEYNEAGVEGLQGKACEDCSE